MSKLEELINTLCPNGVEYKPLKDICELRSGWGFPNSEQGKKEGQYPFFKVGDMNTEGNSILMILSNNYIDENTVRRLKCKPAPQGTIIFPKIGAAISTNKKRILVTNSCYDNNVMGIIPNEKILSKFLFYIMDTINLLDFADNSGAIPSIRKTVMLDYKVPVPPIEVQLEIVRILDNFTELTSELIAKLSEECSKIKKQYEYLKDKCLDFNGKIPTKRFGELARIVRGASPRPIHAFITEKSDGINWIKIGDVKVGNKYITETKEKINKIGASKSRIVKEGDFLLSNSMSFGRPYISAIEGCIHDGWLAISNFEATFTRDFLYHLLSSTKIQRILAKKASFGGAVQNLNADIVRSIELPIPPYAEQKRIAAILDQLDELYNSITKNILTEIEVRKKKYEYYRDKLLTFKELS